MKKHSEYINKIVFVIVRYLGIPYIIREFVQRNKVTIYLLHNVSIVKAKIIFSTLKSYYNIISLKQYVNAVEKGQPLPKKAAIITFDDGYIENYNLLPLIKEMNIPITIYICSELINTKRYFWFKNRNSCLSNYELRNMSNKKRIEYLKSRGIPQDMEFSESRILQRDHIEEMKSYVDFQNHTEFHVSLPQCSEEEAKDEIFRSKEILEKEYGLKIDSLSYPFGDYSDRDIKLLKAAGYKTGITVDFGYNDLKSNLYRLKRISLNDSGDVNEIIVRATGLWAFFKEISGKKIYGFKD